MSIFFEETTGIAGINISGVSSGVAWGDLNGDTLPDLWVNRHWRPGILYLNQGKGTFIDATSEVFLQDRVGDTHGAQWADFDNDGDQDIVELVGAGRGTGSGPNHLYVNDDGKLDDRAEELGVDYPLSRGRTPLWFDFDNDGWLDLLAAAHLRSDGQSPPTIFRQTNNAFEDVGSITGLGDSTIAYALLSDLLGNSNPELIIGGSRVLDLTSTPFEEITNIGTSFFPDMAIADFNGDLLPDLWGTRNGINNLQADLGQYEPNSIAGKFGLRGDEKGVQFSTTGEVRFKISKNYPSSLSPSDIYIGSEGINQNRLWFTLSPDDPDVQGILPHTPGVDRGIYIGYDPTLQQWELLFSSPEDVENFSAIIQSDEPISQFSAIGFEPDDLPQLAFAKRGLPLDRIAVSGEGNFSTIN
ncbi:MAG: FG-GAP repeat domain-containing protein [Xenococcaceae cyanobacterium]